MSFISLHSNWRESWFLRDELGELFLNFSPRGDAVRSTSQYKGLLFLFEAKFKDFSVLLFFSILFLLFTLFDELKILYILKLMMNKETYLDILRPLFLVLPLSSWLELEKKNSSSSFLSFRILFCLRRSFKVESVISMRQLLE